MKRILIAALLLAACKTEDVVLPDPVTMTEDALGHFCQMQLIAHPGPKAQIFLKGQAEPLFFSQVRDAIAYVKGPERDADLIAFYVSDMSVAPSWEDPGNDNWAEATKVRFVVGADVKGGMGAPEIVPFMEPESASRFMSEHGGMSMSLGEIPVEFALSPVEN